MKNMLDEKIALEISRNWIEAWNHHDLDEILSHYAEEIEFCSPFIVKLLNNASGKLQGKSALREYFAKGLTTYPDLKFEPIQVLMGVNSLVIYYQSVRNLQAAEYMIINDQGLITQVTAHYSALP
jgi:ketosteroid isomerase-like protein